MAGEKLAGIGGIVNYMVFILVGVLVAYEVYTELSNQLANVTGLWAVAKTLLGIAIPVFFIILAVKIMQ